VIIKLLDKYCKAQDNKVKEYEGICSYIDRMKLNNCFGCIKQNELQSLRAAVKRFENGREMQNLINERDKAVRKTEGLEKKIDQLLAEIRQLEDDNRSLSLSLSSLEGRYEGLLSAYDTLRERVEEKDRIDPDDLLRTMDRITDYMNEKILSLLHEKEELIGQLAKLKAQITKDNTNSSKPSSQLPNHKTPPNNREKTDRRPGGQPGHKGHRRKRLEPTEEIHHLPAPDFVVNNPDYYKTDEKITKQLIRVSLNLEVIQYEADVYRHHRTRKKVHAAFPEGVVNEVEYDASVCALIALLHSHGNMSCDKIIEVISELTDGRLCPSKGMIANLEKKFSFLSEEDRRKIFNRMLVYPHMHIDGTTVRVNGRNGQVLIQTSPAGTLLYHTGVKGDEAVKGTPAENYEGVSIHDGESTFYHYGKHHQGCLVHELRYLKGSMDNEPHLSWASMMRGFLQFMIHYVKTAKDERSELTGDEIRSFSEQYDAILKTAEQEYEDHPPNMKYYPDGINTMKRLKKHKDAYLYFLNDISIPSQNNPAELIARKEKMHSKQSGGYRSPEYSQYHCDVLSVMESNKAAGTSRYQTLLDVYKRR